MEAISSGGAIETRYARRSGGESRVSAQTVALLAAHGDSVASIVWAEAVQALATGIVNYILLLDPQRVIIGGGVAGAGAQLIDPLRRSIDSELPGWREWSPPVFHSDLGIEAGIIGAALKARTHLQ